MTHPNQLIAVAGATGQQGSVVTRHLLSHGWQVRALTRDPNKPAAQALAELGAELVPGNMENPAELEAAFDGAYGVFSVQNFWLPNVGYEGEVRQGKAVADAAKKAGVQHLVYSSVGAAHRGMGQKHFESKYVIEQYIQALNLPHTFLRPVAFMENHLWSRDKILNGVNPSWGLRKAQQIIAIEDIGVFTALAFANPQEYRGQTLEIAGDDLTESQVAEVFSKVMGRPVAVVAPPQMPEGFTPDEEQVAMMNFFNGEAYTADIPALRAKHPGLLDFEAWVRKTGWN